MEKYYNKNYFNINTLHNMLNKHVNSTYYGYEIKLEMIRSNWKEIIGDKLCEETMPVKLFKNTLYVNCVHQGLINTLLFYKDIILSNLQKRFGDIFIIDSVIFKYGALNNVNEPDNK